MPRQARKKSESGIYHVMLRGINRQQIFEDEEDFQKFISILKDCKAISEFKLFAYCLMGNHIHLLIKPEKETIELIFKRIGSRYVYWYNWKYHRTGHLFQDRYKSEPVDDEVYFLTVLRYIHQNPIKANLSKTIEEYEYSSYREYELKNSTLIDTDFALSITDKKSLLNFLAEDNNDTCLDISDTFRLNDEEAKKIIEQCSRCKTVAEFQRLDSKSRDEYIAIFKQHGLSIRQISRLTGISFGIVRKKFD